VKTDVVKVGEKTRGQGTSLRVDSGIKEKRKAPILGLVVF